MKTAQRLPALRPDQQDSQKGLQAAVREGQGVSPPWLPAWLPGGLLEDDADGYRRGFRASTFGLDGTDLSGGPVTYPGES